MSYKDGILHNWLGETWSGFQRYQETGSVVTPYSQESAYLTGQNIGRADYLAGCIPSTAWYADATPALIAGYENGYANAELEDRLGLTLDSPATEDEAQFENDLWWLDNR